MDTRNKGSNENKENSSLNRNISEAEMEQEKHFLCIIYFDSAAK